MVKWRGMKWFMRASFLLSTCFWSGIVWATPAFKKTPAFSWRQGSIPTSIVFSADSQLVAVAGRGEVHVYDVQSGEEKQTFSAASTWILSAIFSPDDKTLIASDEATKTLRFFDLATGAESASVVLPQAATALAVLPDKSGLVIALADKDVRTVTFAAKPQLSNGLPIVGLNFPATDLAFSSEGKTLVCAGGGAIKKKVTGTGTDGDFAWSGESEGQILEVEWPSCNPKFSQDAPMGSPNCSISNDAQGVAFLGGTISISRNPVSKKEVTKWQSTAISWYRISVTGGWSLSNSYDSANEEHSADFSGGSLNAVTTQIGSLRSPGPMAPNRPVNGISLVTTGEDFFGFGFI